MAALMVFIVFLIAIAVSVPIGVAMCLGTLFPQYFMNAGAPVDQLINFTLSGADSTPILAVPLFILGGVIMAEGGISRRLFNFFSYFVGNIPGRCALRGHPDLPVLRRHSGSGPATTAAVGSMCIPFMVEMGYEKRWSAGLIAVARLAGRHHSALHPLRALLPGHRRFHRRPVPGRRHPRHPDRPVHDGLCGDFLHHQGRGQAAHPRQDVRACGATAS